MSWMFLNDTTPKARAVHLCFLCELPIAKGEVHVSRSGVFEGEAIRQRMHIDCERVTDSWTEDDWENKTEAMEFRRELALFLADEATRSSNSVHHTTSPKTESLPPKNVRKLG